ncbi:MAG: nitrogen regulation protein NR(II) [Pseudomonadales bacterium]
MVTDNLQRILDNLTTAILLLDSGLKVRYLNPAAEMLLEASGSRVIGSSINTLVSEQGRAPSGMINALETGNPYTKRQATFTLSSTHVITIDYAVTPISDHGKVSLLLELTPLDRMLRITREETQLTTQETTRTLVRGLAHEIKNPLGGLRGAAQLLARELPNDDLKDYTNIIIEEADRLRNLVDRMLGPNKVIEFEAVNIHEILERSISLVDVETQGKIRFERNYDPSIPSLLGDREQLIQAVLNVVRNAMQATSDLADGEATISVSSRILRQFTIGKVRHRHVCRINICDNGHGVPSELQQNIFFPMVSGRAEGTGLGLAISQRVMNQHQGLVECTSEPGNTCFSLYIPLEPAHENQ